MTKEIQLTQGKVAIVDDEDYERIMAFGKWRYDSQSEHAVTSIKRAGRWTNICLHRTVLQTDHHKAIFAQNGNRLDCRRENLIIGNGGKHRDRAVYSPLALIDALQNIYDTVPLYKYMSEEKIEELEKTLQIFQRGA